jgi:hypothetical protein
MMASKEALVSTGSRTAVRDLAALILVAVACPVALFGGALLTCAAQGLTPSCALNGILVSPVILLAGGALAGILTRGWPGLGFVTVGVILGLIAIPLLAQTAGNPVPIDPIQGVFALIWFLPPVALGYGVARGVARLVGRSSAGGS